METSSGKKYGLITRQPVKKSAVLLPKLAAFGDSSDEEESAHSAVNQSLQFEARKQKVKKQTQLEIQRALEEDPTVYEYDNVYDSMQQNKMEKLQAKKAAKDSKPKYMENLLKAATQRKREHERRQERKVQREREDEGLQYADKEAFVTSAYKKKMEELAEEEERERREAEMEAANDVTKQKDMSGFYRHILAQTAGEDIHPAKLDDRTNSNNDKKIDIKTEKRTIDETGHQTSSRDEPSTERYPSQDRPEEKYSKERQDGSSKRSHDSSSREGDRHPDRHRRTEGHSSRHRDDDGHRRKHKEEDDEKATSQREEKASSQSLDDGESLSDARPDIPKETEIEDKPESAKAIQKDEKDDDTKKESKFAKRNVEETVMSARDRYLARKAGKGNVKAHVADDDD